MFLLLIGIFLVQLAIAGGFKSVSRPLWFDEILTQTLVADPNIVHSLAAISDGVDFNPPTLHLLLRGYCALWGETNAATLRSFSLLCTMLTLVAIYFTLACGYRPLVACTATLGMWTGETLVGEAFQARFYSLWSMLIALFCFLLSRSDRSFATKWQFALRAVCSVLICTTHYFGIFSLVLVVAGDCLWHRGNRKRIYSLLWSALPGLVALIACTPFFLGQRAALSLPTWIPPIGLSRVLGVIAMLVPMSALSVCAISLYFSELLMGRNRPGLGTMRLISVRPSQRLGIGVSLGTLLVMPAVLLVFSLLVQPSMIPRYAIVACLAFGPLIAVLLDRCQRLFVIFCLVSFTAIGLGSVAKVTNDAQQSVLEREEILDVVLSLPHRTILIEDALDALPLYAATPELRDRLAFLDFEIEELPEASSYAVVNRDVMRRYTRHYPGLQRLTPKDVATIDRLAVLQSEREPIAWSLVGGFRVRPLGGRLYELERLD
ncbi:MAG: hypothetical protein KJ000_12765 [Pirellulaceae bacterium]|nr:hypothetical protein [Pirellulaceae bacterium]